MTSICIYCIHCKDHEEFTCNNNDLPMTDFLRGVRYCRHLNSRGDCKSFKPKSEPESIYELKEDEDLAKTTQHHDFRDKDEN